MIAHADTCASSAFRPTRACAIARSSRWRRAGGEWRRSVRGARRRSARLGASIYGARTRSTLTSESRTRSPRRWSREGTAVRGIIGACRSEPRRSRRSPSDSRRRRRSSRRHDCACAGLEVAAHVIGVRATPTATSCWSCHPRGSCVAADLVYVGLHPFIDSRRGRSDRRVDRRPTSCSSCAERWVRGGRTVVVVRGHGAPAQDRRRWRPSGAYFERLREAVEERCWLDVPRRRDRGPRRTRPAPAGQSGDRARRARSGPRWLTRNASMTLLSARVTKGTVAGPLLNRNRCY